MAKRSRQKVTVSLTAMTRDDDDKQVHLFIPSGLGAKGSEAAVDKAVTKLYGSRCWWRDSGAAGPYSRFGHVVCTARRTRSRPRQHDAPRTKKMLLEVDFERKR